MEGSSIATAREHDVRVSAAGSRVAEEHVASRLLLQECEVRYVSDDDDSQSLHVALQRQDDPLHGKANAETVVCDELHHLSPRYSGVQAANGEL